MKTAIHLIGPKDTVALVEQVALEFADRLSLTSFVYEDVEEVPTIIAQHDHDADVWLFTGRVSYAWSKQHNIDRKSLMIQSQGSALMKQLHFALRDGYTQPDRLSLDTLTMNEVTETMRELELHGTPYLYPQPSYVPAAQLVAFHEDAYRSGRVDACITHRGFVYEALRARGIPAYRSIPTVMSIRQTLHLACQQGETNHFRKSQIAMLLVRINLSAVSAKQSYEAYRMNLKVQETILRYAEHIAGALLPTGGGTYTVFSTRGALEQQATEFPPHLLAEQVRLLTAEDVSIGIGYGLTAFEAEQNASLALSHADKRERGDVVVVDEHGTIAASYAGQETLAYKYKSDDLATIEQLKQAGVSVATYHKIAAVQASSGQRAVSAAHIASRLDMTQRNANRILTDLERCGLAAIVGEEAPAKGRPRKLYRIGG